MSAAKKSRPARVADEIEAADRGWEVERIKDGNRRVIVARRAGSRVLVEWRRDGNGRDLFFTGEHFVQYEGSEVCEESFSNVSAKVREMTAPPAVPFDPETSSDADVLAAVAGKTVTWRNSVTGCLSAGDVPRGGVHLTLTGSGASRTLSFPAAGQGFRSVRLSAIEKVS